MDFVTTSCHDTGTILPRRVRDPTSALKMRQCWQGSCEQRIKCWNTDQNKWKYLKLFPSSRRRLEPSLDKNVPSSIFMKNTPVESFKHVYTGSIRKEILHSWTCPHVVTRLLANATNDNLRVKWEVSFSFKTARWCFFWCLQSPLFLWPTTPPVKLWGKTLGWEDSLASLHLLGQNLIAGWSANSKVNQCHKHFRADFTSVQKCIRAEDKAFVLMPPLVKRFTRCQKETRDR